MTREQIVERLLEEKKITAEEAVILLMSKEKEFIVIPGQPILPVPMPSWIQPPFTVTCSVNGVIQN